MCCTQYIDHFSILVHQETKLLTKKKQKKVLRLENKPRFADLHPPRPATQAATKEEVVPVQAKFGPAESKHGVLWGLAAYMTLGARWYPVMSLTLAFVLNVLLVLSWQFGHIERPNGLRITSTGPTVKSAVFTTLGVAQFTVATLALVSYFMHWSRLMRYRGEQVNRQWAKERRVAPPRNMFLRLHVWFWSKVLAVRPARLAYYHLRDFRFLVHFFTLIVSALGIVVTPYGYAFHIVSFVPEMPVLLSILSVLKKRWVHLSVVM